MRIKIKKTINTGAGGWYQRDYLAGRTCEVIAFQTRKTKTDEPSYKCYFVLHPITKKSGYWVNEKHCEVIEKSKVPTWVEFLKNNKYGYKVCPVLFSKNIWEAYNE